MAPPTKPVISADRKLRLYIGGDSMARELGESLLDKANSRLVDASLDFRISSGLARPDYYNWPAHLQDVVGKDEPPDAAVVLFGANDGQNLERKGDVLDFGSPAWLDEYHLRVGATMDILYAQFRTVYWVGMPICRDGDYSERMRVENQVVPGGGGQAAVGALHRHLPAVRRKRRRLRRLPPERRRHARADAPGRRDPLVACGR